MRREELPDGWLATLFEHGIDLPNRRVFIGEITTESALSATKGLYALETESDKEPIDLFINSCGGDIGETLGLYDIINTLRCPVHTFASGICMSAAPLLLAAGEPGHRWVGPNLRLMIHDWAASIEGKGKHVESEFKETKLIDDIWLDCFSEKTKKPKSFWKRLSTKPFDYYYDSERAIEWGVADTIWFQK